MKTLFLTVALTFSAGVAANTTAESTDMIGDQSMVVSAPVDMKAVMKEMRLEYKLGERATSIEDMNQVVTKLESLIEQLKQGEYTPEKQAMYQEGFNKLSVSVALVKTELDAGDLEKAQAVLEQVDELRVEYHKKRNPSIWSKIFG
ncbi:cytochrome b562 [Aliivibrio sp. S3MY1]|uniref:cytochrome b562 n=1 Tax=unclassified Aliivibrio TaxID=2645654 RepID=UPI002378DC9D|nr:MULTISPECIES: cytochrome b562 [unclassified Aliivibrio]MDD9194461.1 cytochrome b562 [Aliivibrio sp. S3MY1]MDD9198200.1 cytochrome b562 [Aliivibrio sp. S2MY1]